MTDAVEWIFEDEILATDMWRVAVNAVGDALSAGLDPAAQQPRTRVDLASGELLLMPSEFGDHVGVKIASVMPSNAERGLPRIQGVYTLLDSATLTPSALLDGTALTTLRTSTVSAYAVSRLCSDRVERLAVMGTGSQAWGHAHAIGAVVSPSETVIVGRDPGRTASLVSRLCSEGVPATGGSVADVADAEVVVCATGADKPILDADDVAPGACVVAVGSHHPDRRELGGRLLERATVVVEDRTTALREAGDVVMAIHEGHLRADDLVDLRVLADSEYSPPPGMSIFKSVGMGWQDLVVAAAVVRQRSSAATV